MPWVHFHADTDGFVKACCSTSVTYGDLSSNDVPSIWEGDAIKAFREQIKESGVDRRCNSCLKREAVDKSSMRTETNAKYKDLVAAIETGETVDVRPRYFDIRFSNLCNLKCRTCWHGASSSWFEEAKRLKNNLGDKAIITATKDNFSLLDDLLSYSVDLDEIYFAGGEPLMMEEHYYLLDKLLALNQTNVKLRYNTNLSQLKLKDKSVLDYWSKFEKIHFLISIDAMEDQLAYVRKGISWNRILRNIESISEVLPNVQLEIAPTVSVFNVLKLADLHSFFYDRGLIGINEVYLNLLQRPFEYNIKTLSEGLKQQVSESLEEHITWLGDNEASSFIINEYRAILDFMHSESIDNYHKRFRKQTQILDEWRGESFIEVFPELKSLIE